MTMGTRRASVPTLTTVTNTSCRPIHNRADVASSENCGCWCGQAILGQTNRCRSIALLPKITNASSTLQRDQAPQSLLVQQLLCSALPLQNSPGGLWPQPCPGHFLNMVSSERITLSFLSKERRKQHLHPASLRAFSSRAMSAGGYA